MAVLLIGWTNATVFAIPQQTFQHHSKRLSLPETVKFNSNIRPIMSNTCFACHGPDETVNESGLRLDSFEAALEADAILPGNAAESPVYQRLVDSNDPMPPAEFLHQLTDYEKALFKKWIDQGAKYQQHWSYTAIERPTVPTVEDESWVANSVDRFVLRRLEKEKVSPSAQADKATLLRRLSLDLIGVPPTIQEVEDFQSDDSPNAYEKQVDRLLANPKYGERMASRWLDIVRFSDTVGFHGDQNQRIFPYRDYVIDSINQNQPFDEFTKEQLAGDLLPDPTDAQLVATGLVRLNMMTREGGAQPKEYLAKYAADRVRMVGTAWLGATTGCCECHNHKYDPFTIKDFYSLSAFFNDVQQWGVYSDYGYTPNPDLRGFNNDFPFPPEIRVQSPSLSRQLDFLESQFESVAAKLVTNDVRQSAEFRVWWDDLLQAWSQTKTLNVYPNVVQAPQNTETKNDQTILFTSKPNEDSQHLIDLQLDYETIVRSVQVEVDPQEIHNGLVGRNPDGSFQLSLSAAHLKGFDSGQPSEPIAVRPRFLRIELTGRNILSLAEVQVLSDDQNIAPTGTASQSSDDHAGVADRAIDGETNGNYHEANSVTHTRNEDNPWWELDLGEAKQFDSVQIWNRTDKQYSSRLRDFKLVLLDENREVLFRASPNFPNPNVSVTIPQTVSKFDLVAPLPIANVQANRFSANRYRSGYPSPYVDNGVWKSGSNGMQRPEQEAKKSHHAVFHLAKPIRLSPQDRLRITLNSNDVGSVKFSLSAVTRPVADSQPNQRLREIVSKNSDATIPVDDLTSAQDNALRAAYYSSVTPFDQFPKQLTELRQAIANCYSGYAFSLISQPVPEDKLLVGRVFRRGDWQDDQGEIVVPNTPAFLVGYQPKPERRLTRLDLANWITSPDNPLTARHYVNRTWKHFFGAGLSNVLDDLGNQGEWPSHPELLDWLASEFRSDWDRKRITKLIVTSQTYRQTAATRDDLTELDPYNRLLAQQSARRLEAEIVRDNALAISGLLNDKWVGGPSVFPYQPPGYYANLQFPNRRYTQQLDGRQYRRGLYMHWQRTFLHPMLANFDAPSRDECTADRTESNSPQQALTLLNDPVFVEAANAFAVRLMRESTDTDLDSRIRLAFQLALARTPQPVEKTALQSLYQKQLEYYQANPEQAQAWQTTGQFSNLEFQPTEIAALAQVCRVILNLHETITRY